MSNTVGIFSSEIIIHQAGLNLAPPPSLNLGSTYANHCAADCSLLNCKCKAFVCFSGHSWLMCYNSYEHNCCIVIYDSTRQTMLYPSERVYPFEY